MQADSAGKLWRGRQLLGLAVWLIIIFYLILAPMALGPQIVKEGRPISFLGSMEGFEANQNGKAYFDSLYLYDKRGVYELSGWAFSTVDLPVDYYLRNLALSGPAGVLLFEAIEVNRQDVANHFSEGNLTMAGLKIRISKFSIPTGLYRIIITFTSGNQDTQFLETPYCLLRTPNQIVLVSNCGED